MWIGNGRSIETKDRSESRRSKGRDLTDVTSVSLGRLSVTTELDEFGYTRLTGSTEVDKRHRHVYTKDQELLRRGGDGGLVGSGKVRSEESKISYDISSTGLRSTEC